MLEFETFSLDVGRGVLLRGAAELRLRRQTFEVLLYLAERAGRVVSSHELVNALWTSAPADANASTGQCIKEIRRALGADGRWIIKTVTGCGYEFKAIVTTDQRLPLEDVLQAEVAFASAPRPMAAGSAKSVRQSLFSRQSLIRYSAMLAAVGAIVGWGRWLWLASDPPQEALTMMAIPAIAVPPFKIEVSDDSAAAPGGGSIGELVRSELAHASPGLDLVIKSAIEHQTARSADSNRGVRYLVLGTSWHRQRTQHLNVQLTAKESGEQIWARAFSFDRDQIGAQERTAALVAREIGVAVRHTEARRPLPPAPEAGHFALQGFALLESERGSQLTLPALALFENALAIDANSLSAMHGLARLKISMARGGAWMLPRAWRIAMLDQADTAIQNVLKHDPRNLAVQALRGSLLRERRQVDDALAAFELVLSKNPNDSFSLAELGRTKIDAGRSREAIAHLGDAIQLSPTDPLIYLRYFWAGMAAVHLSDDATAVKWLIKARQANQFYPHSSMWLAVAYQRLGDDENANAMMAEYRKAVLSFTIAGWKKHYATNNVVVADQRKSIETALRRLVPEIASVEAEHPYSRSIPCAGFRFC
jgi:DNA-binding winged helix-turn-helix (wHTH) protein/tetratricopeptide (TPR) repeat protein